MKSLIYILLIANLILLAVNWGSVGSPSQTPEQQQELPELLATGEDSAQDFPVTSVVERRGAALQVLDVFFGVITGLWDAFAGLFTTEYRTLPTELTSSPEPPPPPPPPEPLACYDVTGYDDRAAATKDQELLNIYGVQASLETSSKTVEDSRYRVMIRSRYNLDIAEQLSQELSASAIPNSINEWAPNRFRLETPIYDTKAEAEAIYQKAKKLGYSTELVTAGDSITREVTAYYLRIPQDQAVDWQEQQRIITPQLGEDAKITELESC